MSTAALLDPATLTVGEAIAPMTVTPSEVQLFRFSAVTWNAHRIHYDQTYARDVEGYPGVLVQSHLHGCFLMQAALDWAGPEAVVHSFSWQNRGLAVAGDELTCTGTVTDVTVQDARVRVGIDLEERNQRGDLCAPGRIVLSVGAGS
jgi:hydroxyacyl-ACP dehydratase HTD2-like protein with hotdog domain